MNRVTYEYLSRSHPIVFFPGYTRRISLSVPSDPFSSGPTPVPSFQVPSPVPSALVPTRARLSRAHSPTLSVTVPPPDPSLPFPLPGPAFRGSNPAPVSHALCIAQVVYTYVLLAHSTSLTKTRHKHSSQNTQVDTQDPRLVRIWHTIILVCYAHHM